MWNRCVRSTLLAFAFAASVTLVPMHPASAQQQKMIVGYVAAVSSNGFVVVLDRDGYPGQVRGMELQFTVAPGTRILDHERPAHLSALEVRRQATVMYEESKGVNVAREVRLLGSLPPGVPLPGGRDSAAIGARSTAGEASTRAPVPGGVPMSPSPTTKATPSESRSAGRAWGSDPYKEGMRLYDARQDRAAVEAFTAAIKRDPRRVEAYIGRGLARHALGQYQAAIEDYATALRLKPDSEEAFLYRGRAYRALRQGDRAIADFTAATRANPASGKGFLERADAYQMFYPNRPRTALNDIEEAIRREPKNALYYNRRGALHYETNNFGAAMSDFNHAISLKRDFAAAYCNRGLTHYWHNRKDQAAADFRQCLVLNPALRPTLEAQVQLIPHVRQWQADFRRWYAEVLASATRSRDDTCSTAYSGNADRISNCRRHGVSDTDDKVRKNQL